MSGEADDEWSLYNLFAGSCSVKSRKVYVSILKQIANTDILLLFQETKTCPVSLLSYLDTEKLK